MPTADGVPVRVPRTGISGELGYDLHRPTEPADEIWAAVVASGQDVGMRQLGFRAQPVQHIEAGIATDGLDHLPASILPSLLGAAELPGQMELPRGRGPRFGQVLVSGDPVGVATGTTVSRPCGR